MKKIPFSDCFILGEGAQYTVLGWLIGRQVPMDQRDEDIHIAYAAEPAVDACEDGLWYYTDKLLPGLTLHFPSSTLLWDISFQPFSRCIFVEEYPWNHEELRKRYLELRQSWYAPSLFMVILNLPPRTGSTDLDHPEQVLTQICHSLECEHIPYHVISNPSELPIILNWSESASLGWVRQSRAFLDVFRSDIEDIAPSNEDNLFYDAQSRICSLETVRQYAQPYIWDCYSNAAEDFFFPNRTLIDQPGLYALVDQYRSILESQPLVRWDIEKDCAQFTQILKQHFRDTLNSNRIAGVPIAPDIDLTTYLQIKYTEGPEYQIDHHFWVDTVRVFIEQTAHDLLRDRLKQQYNRLEALLP